MKKNRSVPAPHIHPPFGNYSHGVEVPRGSRLVFCSGQLAIDAAGNIPTDGAGQVRLCFENIANILAGSGMILHDVVRLNCYVTDRDIWADYMAIRDEYIGPVQPASTLMMVSGFTREEFRIEIEAVAARDDEFMVSDMLDGAEDR